MNSQTNWQEISREITVAMSQQIRREAAEVRVLMQTAQRKATDKTKRS